MQGSAIQNVFATVHSMFMKSSIISQNVSIHCTEQWAEKHCVEQIASDSTDL